MAISQHMASSFLPEKSSGSLAFMSPGLVVVLATSMSGCSGVGLKDSSSSLVILILVSGTGAVVGSGKVEVVMDRGSSAVDNSHHDRMLEFLQALYIPL